MTYHDPSVSLRSLDAPSLNVHVSTIAGKHVVNVCGELDVRTRHFVEQACVAGDDVAVVVEMGDLTFMDCCGYAGLVAARRALQEHGGSLTLRNEVGQPARLLAMLAVEHTAHAVASNGATSS